MSSEPGARNVVLVHGGFVDGSGWQAVHDLLTQDGYRVAVVQNPTRSLEDDAAATRRVIYLSQPAAVAALIGQAATAVAG
jgi:hypothetical protein